MPFGYNPCTPCCISTSLPSGDVTCYPIPFRNLWGLIESGGGFGNYLAGNSDQVPFGAGPLYQYYPTQKSWLGVALPNVSGYDALSNGIGGLIDYPDTYYLMHLFCSGGMDQMVFQCFNWDNEPADCPFGSLSGVFSSVCRFPLCEYLGFSFSDVYRFSMADSGVFSVGEIGPVFTRDGNVPAAGVKFIDINVLDSAPHCQPGLGVDGAFCLNMSWQDNATGYGPGYVTNYALNVPISGGLAQQIHQIFAFLSPTTGQLSLSVDGNLTTYTPTAYHNLLPPVKIDYGNVSLPSPLCQAGTFRAFADTYTGGGVTFFNPSPPPDQIGTASFLFCGVQTSWHDEIDLVLIATYNGPDGQGYDYNISFCQYYKLTWDPSQNGHVGTGDGLTFKHLLIPFPAFQSDDMQNTPSPQTTFYNPMWVIEISCQGRVIARYAEAFGGFPPNLISFGSQYDPCLANVFAPIFSQSFSLIGLTAQTRVSNFTTQLQGTTCTFSDSGDACWDGQSGLVTDTFGACDSCSFEFPGRFTFGKRCHFVINGFPQYTDFGVCVTADYGFLNGVSNPPRVVANFGALSTKIVWLVQQVEPTLYLKFVAIPQCPTYQPPPAPAFVDCSYPALHVVPITVTIME